jgi:hypothetical protein
MPHELRRRPADPARPPGATFFQRQPKQLKHLPVSPTLAETWWAANSDSHARSASIVVSPRPATCARIAA